MTGPSPIAIALRIAAVDYAAAVLTGHKRTIQRAARALERAANAYATAEGPPLVPLVFSRRSA